MFYNQNTFSSFYKSEPRNLSHFIMKLIEELRILLLKLKLGLPLKSKSPNSLSEKLGIFILGMFMQTDCKSSERIAHVFVKWWQCREKWERDEISLLHKHKEFTQSWKLCLNLCSLRWLSPILNLVRNFKPIMNVIIWFSCWLTNL